MRLGIKGKQVLYVTSLVGGVVVVLSVLHVARLARVSLEESQSRAGLLANAIYHRAREVVEEVPAGTDPSEALRHDPGLRSILESSLYDRTVAFAALADAQGFAVAHADPARQELPLAGAASLNELLSRAPVMQLRAIYSDRGRNLELRQPLFLPGNVAFGSIRIGISTLLIRSDLNASLGSAVVTALLALTIAVVVAMLLAQLLLRPIHVIRSGLTRLGRGEFGVRLDLNQQDEFGELGTFFNTVSAQLSADRSQMAGQVAHLESAVERLEDAVAMVSPTRELLFANPAMRALLPGAIGGARLDEVVRSDHPMRQLTEQTLTSRESRRLAATFSDDGPGDTVAGERLIQTHPVNDAKGDLVGVMVIVRDLEYLGQVQSTVRYSRKLAALGRLSAGVAHEVKNPLNAMMIHLELLRQYFAADAVAERATSPASAAPFHSAVATAPAPPLNDQALQHVDVIAAEIKRLDQVVQGFLKFARPEDLKLQRVRLAALLAEVVPIVRPEADGRHVELAVESGADLEVNGDPTMLRQAFLNLALNACQAMPNGGSLTIRSAAARPGRVSITFVDTGVGIRPEHLNRIFDLYFTTRERGSGVGLSMVYRTIQMHDGEIEVESTVGKGATFRVLLPAA